MSGLRTCPILLHFENSRALNYLAREHAAAADAEDERVAKLAAEGKLRGKKRDRGIGLNDDDSEESDDDDDRRRRRAVNKKRRIEGDTMDELGELMLAARYDVRDRR